MAKAKKTERELARRLHSLGIRKGVAENIAHSTGRLEGQLPSSARKALKDMVSVVGEVGDRLGGSSQTRKAAGEKAAKTRKRNAAKRSDAAKRAAKTRAAKKAAKK